MNARLIVVEDNFPVANSLKYLLEAAGLEVVGMAANVEIALELVATIPFDLALLDINLRGEHASPIAEATIQQGKPVIFLTGYGEASMLPPHLRALPRLDKPVDPGALIALIDRALDANSAK
jgi:DNA-binding NtrC family response regulator